MQVFGLMVTISSEFTTAGAQVYQTRNGLHAGAGGGGTSNTDCAWFQIK